MFFAKPKAGSTPDKDKASDYVGLGSVRLLAQPAAQGRGEDELQEEEDVGGVEGGTAKAKKRQLLFLDRLSSIKKSKGEMDTVPLRGWRPG